MMYYILLMEALLYFLNVIFRKHILTNLNEVCPIQTRILHKTIRQENYTRQFK